MAVREIKTTLALDGEKQYKASLDDAYRAMRVLGSEMKATTAAFGDSGKSVEGLRAKNDVLNKQIEQQRKLVESLTKAVAESAELNKDNEKITDQYRIKLNNAAAALSRMENELVSNEKSISELGDETKKTTLRTEEFKSKLESLDKSLSAGVDLSKKLIAGVAAVGAAAVAAGKQIWDLTVQTGKYADELITTSTQTGISTQSLQEWGYAAQFIDTEVDTITKSMARMIKQMGTAKDGSEKSKRSFEKLGVSITDANGALRKSEDVFFDAIDALGKMSNETERDAIAMELFGRSAQELNPLIKAGAKELKALSKEARDLGIVMTDDAIKAFGAFDDQMNRMNSTVQAVKQSFVTAMLPAMETVQEAVSGLATKFNEWIRSDEAQATLSKLSEAIMRFAEYLGNNFQSILEALISLFDGIVNIVVFVIDNFDVLKGVVIGLTTALVAFKAAQLAVNIAMTAMFNPMGLIVPVITVLSGLFGGLIGGLSGARKGIDNLSNRITPFNDSVNGMSPTLLNVNDLLSKSGKTVRELDSAIRQSEEAITAVLAKALKENRSLRADELESIKSFNVQLLALQAEKLQLYRDQQLAELRKLQVEEATLTQEQAAQRITNARAAYQQSNAITEEAYTAQLAIIENKYRAMGEVGSTAHQQELASAKSFYDASLAENQNYYASAYAVVSNGALKWVAADQEKWQALQGLYQGGSRDFKRHLEQMDLDNANAFLSIVLTAKKQGAILSEDTKKTAKLMLDAFDDLPPYLESAGKNAMLGVTKGMEKELPELKNTSKMSASEIVNVIKAQLGIHSPSTVMHGFGVNIVKGLWEGISGMIGWIGEKVRGFANSIVGWFRDVLGIKSPSRVMAEMIGKPMAQGVASGLLQNTHLIDAVLKRIKPSTSLLLDVTRRFNDVGMAGKVTANQGSNRFRLDNDSIVRLADALAGKLNNDPQKDIVLVLNDREIGRYIRRGLAGGFV